MSLEGLGGPSRRGPTRVRMPSFMRLPAIRCTARAVLLGLVCVAAVACGAKDPRQQALQERGRWEVRLLSWVQNDDGSLLLSTRLSGPPNSKLDRLTVRFHLLDAAEETAERVWHTYDLSQVPRGLPQDFEVRLPAVETTSEGIGISRVLEPSPEEEPHIVELARSPSG